MGKPKREGRKQLPDRRLADAFRFSAIDLAANRAGYMSLAQRWALPPSWQRLFGVILNRLPKQGMTPIHKLRGRAHLHYQQHQIHAFHRIDIREQFTVQFDGGVFSLTAKQYRVLSPDVLYDVYCTDDGRTILSLERAVQSHLSDG